MRHYYAIEHAYGAHVVNNGVRANSIRRFDSEVERDRWITDGVFYSRQAGHRRVLKASDPRVRTMNRQVAEGLLAWEDDIR